MELRGLGAKVVFASFSKVILATPKESLRDAQDYCRFVVDSLQKKQVRGGEGLGVANPDPDPHPKADPDAKSDPHPYPYPSPNP